VSPDNYNIVEPVRAIHPWVGKTIGELAILGEIGRGHSGAVLLAKEAPAGGRVAVKVLSDEFSGSRERVSSFIEEARKAAQLRHPNILRVFRIAQYQGLYFIVMEFAGRGTVKDILQREGRLPLERALKVVRDAAEGLAFAAAVGIVHHDVKPANLLVSGKDIVKVSDFGIADRTGEKTADGDTIYGSPHYMAPEQALGEPATSLSDIYSLGATFYHILAGRPPFVGKGVRELILKHLNDEPTPVNRIVPILPKRVAEVVGTMMAKRKEDRYQTFAQVLQELYSLEDIRTLDKLDLSSRRRKER
jgi:serine/threonine-protein kinase